MTKIPGRVRVDMANNGLQGPQKLTRDEALALVGGKTEKPRGIDPRTWISEDADHYLGMVPISMLGDPRGEVSVLDWVGVGDPNRAEEYARRSTQAPPVVITVSKRTEKGFAYLIDGGHRLKAAMDQGKTSILAVVLVKDGVPLDPRITAPPAPKVKPELIGYEWRNREGEKHSAWDGGLVPAKVSDWDRTEVSAGSGREIVHVYWIRDSTGEIKPYGKQTALKILGIPCDLFEKKAKRFMDEIMRKKVEAENNSRAFDSLPKHSSIAEANRAWRLSHAKALDFEQLEQLFGTTAVFEKGGLFITRTKGTDTAALAETKGYRIVMGNHNPAGSLPADNASAPDVNEEDNGPSPR